MKLRINKKYYVSMPSEDYEALKEDIRLNKGNLKPIEVTSKGEILDGVHRYKACKELGLKPNYIILGNLTEEQKEQRRISAYLGRTKTAYQKCQIAFKFSGVTSDTELSRQKREELSKRYGVSEGSIAQYCKVMKEASEEQKEQLESGEISLKEMNERLMGVKEKTEIAEEKKKVIIEEYEKEQERRKVKLEEYEKEQKRIAEESEPKTWEEFEKGLEEAKKEWSKKYCKEDVEWMEQMATLLFWKRTDPLFFEAVIRDSAKGDAERAIRTRKFIEFLVGERNSPS